MNIINLTDPRTIRHLLAKQNLKPKKSLGQNFLICPEVIEAALLALSKNTKHVTELGPGLGALTQALTASGYAVKAIEKDSNMASILKKVLSRSQSSRLTLINEDLRATDWTWNESYQLVGNIPYNLSGIIIRLLTQLENQPKKVILLTQKEVGERLTAILPHMHLLTVAVQLWGKTEKILNVPRNCFWPAPQVDSSLLLLTPYRNNPLSVADREKIMQVVKVCFRSRRKQIGGSLRRIFSLSDEAIKDICRQADIKPSTRPQELAVENWRLLTETLDQRGRKLP